MDFNVIRAPVERDRETVLILGGAAFFQAVVAGHRLGLFRYLSTHPGAEQEVIAQDLQLPVASLRTLLMACQSLRWIERNEVGGYRNVGWVDQALGGDETAYPALLEGFEQILYQPFTHLTKALKSGSNLGLAEYPGTGDTLYERLQSYPALESVFHSWMSNLSAPGLPALLVDALAGHSHVLDVGGGDGTNALIMARAHPRLRVTILDLPSVCEKARARIAEAGLSERITTRACDIRTTLFPSGCDAVLFSRIFNIYREEQNQLFVQRASQVLPAGGKLLIYPSMMADDDGGGPLSGAFLSLYFLCLATGEGRVYSPSDYQEWCAQAGFQKLTCQVDENDDAVLIGIR